MGIGKRLRELRKSEGMSQVEVSVKSSIAQGNISDIENGKNVPSIEVASRIADAIGYELRVDFVKK